MDAGSNRPMDWLVRLVAAPKDDPATVQAKVAWLILMIVSFGMIPFALYGGYTTNDFFLFWLAIAGIFVVGLPILYLTIAKKLTPRFMALSAISYMICVVMVDIVSMTTGTRSWALSIIIIDVLLIAPTTPEWLHQTCVGICSVWIVVSHLELEFRFGLLDLPGLLPYEERARSYCTCEQPPCGEGQYGTMLGWIVLSLPVFLVDYRATRGFAMRLREEQKKVEAAQTATRYVAMCLSRFDLKAAECALETAADQGMPLELKASFDRLLANLRSYRPYLPQGLVGCEISSEDTTSDDDASADSNRAVDTQGPLSLASSFLEGSVSLDMSAHLPVAVGRDSAGNAMEYVPPGRPSPTESRVTLMLRTECISMLVINIHLEFTEGAANYTQYVSEHRDSVAQILHEVRSQRGTISHFHGERVYAVYNAFRKCATHASVAVSTLLALRTDLSHTFMSAVATGHAGVGTLGTQTMMSPSIVGRLRPVLEAVAVAGDMLGLHIACNSRTAEKAEVSVPLRVALHHVTMAGSAFGGGLNNTEVGDSTTLAVLIPVEEIRRVPLQLWFADVNAVQEKSLRSLDDVQDVEWMYTIENEPGILWAAYNEAGKAYHRCGIIAAREVLVQRKASAEVSSMFEGAMLSARVLDLAPRFVADVVDTRSPIRARSPRSPRVQSPRHLSPSRPHSFISEDSPRSSLSSVVDVITA